MTKRPLYIAAYDVSEPARLRKVHHVVKRFATGGQKSVFECFLTPSERDELLTDVREILDEDEDRLALLRVEPRARASARIWPASFHTSRVGRVGVRVVARYTALYSSGALSRRYVPRSASTARARG